MKECAAPIAAEEHGCVSVKHRGPSGIKDVKVIALE
jgi:hypothetical protein